MATAVLFYKYWVSLKNYIITEDGEWSKGGDGDDFFRGGFYGKWMTSKVYHPVADTFNVLVHLVYHVIISFIWPLMIIVYGVVFGARIYRKRYQRREQFVKSLKGSGKKVNY